MNNANDNWDQLYLVLIFDLVGDFWRYRSAHIAAHDTEEAERIFLGFMEGAPPDDTRKYFLLTKPFTLAVWPTDSADKSTGTLTKQQFEVWKSLMSKDRGRSIAPYREIKKVKPLYLVDGQGGKNEKG